MSHHRNNPRIGPRLSYLAYGLVIIVILSAGVGLAVFRPWSRPQQVIRIGVLKITPSIRYWIAQEKGIFEKYGLTVEIKDDYFSTNDIANDVAAGKIDVGHFAASTVFQVWSIQPESMYIFTLDLNTPENHIDNLFLSKDSTVVRPEDLRGRPIGKFPGEQATIVLKSYLETQGLNEDEIVLIDIAPQSQISALTSNQVAALYAYEPIGTLLSLDHESRQLVSGVTVHTLNPFPGGAGVFSSAFLSARPDDAKRFVQAIREATNYVNDPANNLDVRKSLSDHLSVRFDIATKTFWLVWRNMEEIDLENLQNYADFQVTHGQLSIPIDVRDLMYRE
jgi:ABC-type nitrate/sulfonate/bicarbonate transport system substrate-binding protein